MAKRKKKGGRPLKHSGEGAEYEMIPELGRAPLSRPRSFRVRPGLDRLLQAAAGEASRTVSQEIEHRLERSFHDDRVARAHFGNDVGAELLRMFYSVMVFEGVHPDWSGDPIRAEHFRTAMNGVIAGLLGLPLELPPPEKRVEGLETAKQFLLRSSKRRNIPKEIMSSHWDPTADWDPSWDKLTAEEEPTTNKR
jgi:hypothetical protein